MEEINSFIAVSKAIESGSEKKAAKILGCSVTFLYRLMPSGSIVYFIESNGLVKIGTTRDIVSRLKTIRNMNSAPVSLIGFFEGSKLDEMALHERWNPHRDHGEWFTLSNEIKDFIGGFTYAKG